MIYKVSVTSQGRITIPVVFRRKLGFEKNRQAFVTEQDGRLIVEPIKDFLELGGSLKNKAIKGKTIDEIIQFEEEAIAKGFIDDYKKTL